MALATECREAVVKSRALLDLVTLLRGRFQERPALSTKGLSTLR